MFCFISLKIKNEWLRGVLVFGIGGIGVLLGTYHLFLPCYIDSAMSALPFSIAATFEKDAFALP